MTCVPSAVQRRDLAVGVAAAQLPELVGRDRHPGDREALGVLDGRRDDGRHGDAARLAGALDAQGIQRRRGLEVVGLDGRHLGRVGHEEVHEARVEQLARLVVGHPLVERATDALGDAAVDLALDDHRVDHRAAVVDDAVAQDRISAVTGSVSTIAACMPLAKVAWVGE